MVQHVAHCSQAAWRLQLRLHVSHRYMQLRRQIGPAPLITASRPRWISFTTTKRIRTSYDLHLPPKVPDVERKLNNPIIFMHGLFGSKRNNRAMSKILARKLNRPVYAIDLRNHGDSEHHETHTYEAMAQDVAEFIEDMKLQNTTLIGHSMGAKTAMTLALKKPSVVANLIPVDNAPVDATLKTDFAKYIQGLRKIEDSTIQTMKDADEILQPFEPNLAIRQFLLTNVTRSHDGRARFRIPLNTLAKSLDHMGDFPFKDPDETRFEGPVLMVRGTKSHYVPDETLPIIGRFFPRFELKDIEAGHWIISENPTAFESAVVEFLSDKT